MYSMPCCSWTNSGYARFTLKRHAVLTATLGRVSYAEIAQIMNCSVTTVKLLLRGALDVLGIQDRNMLLVSWPLLLNFIEDEEYEKRYGLSKRWWLAEGLQYTLAELMGRVQERYVLEQAAAGAE